MNVSAFIASLTFDECWDAPGMGSGRRRGEQMRAWLMACLVRRQRDCATQGHLTGSMTVDGPTHPTCLACHGRVA